ncbi:MAG: RnfABCDGE type electron transport complex subunit D [Eubacteriales bacterium]|nr:RnfABCDGE type electron transport complex subunit D [Eubacteriales bacterium]
MQMLKVSASPHIRDKSTTTKVMGDVVIALLPALVLAYMAFGWRAIVLTFVTTAACVFFEWAGNRLMHRPQTISDLSAVVTGVLLAFNFPANFPWWMAILGAFVAIVGAKLIFGGLGYNITNPALTARVFLLVCFPQEMTNFVVLGKHLKESGAAAYDLCSSATVLSYIGNPEAGLPSLSELFIGLKAGSIGEVSILALLIGAAYLLIKRVIDIWIPLSFIATTMIVVTLGGQSPLYHLLSGGLILGAFFMATDYVSTPYSPKGKFFFGLGAGLITGLIRLYGGTPEGVSYAILVMNILTPHLNKWCREKPLSHYRQKQEKGAANA